MSDVLQRIEVTVSGKSKGWTDTGLVLKADEELRVIASGSVVIDSSEGQLCFPEGRYVDDDRDPMHSYNPSGTVQEPPTAQASRFPATNIRPWSLAVAVRAGSTPPNAGMDSGAPITDALQGSRNITFADTQLGGGGRVWLIVNDYSPNDNRRAFTVMLERLGTMDPLYPGTVSPIRFVPPDVFREKQKSVENTAICWFIRPKWGEPEGYTEMDFTVECPVIQMPTGCDETGATLYTTLPALSYKPFSGLAITGIPTSVKLGVDAPDVTLINFDKTKLRREYYEEAEVEVFEVALDGDRSQVLSYLSGVIGNCQGDDLQATIELTPWDELTNLPSAWKLGFICDVGRLPGEEFGTKRCLNEKRFNGVNIEEWTRGAKIVRIDAPSRIVIEPEIVSGSDGFEADFPGSYGIIQFQSGELDLLRRDVGKFDPVTGIVDLRRALPFAPVVGDTLTFKAGCDRTFNGQQGCIFWQGGRNFRNTPHLPGRKALSHTIKI